MKTGKKILSLLLSLMLVLGAVSVGGVSASAEDGGIVWNAAENRYEISDSAGLKKFADIVNGANGETQNSGACAILTADIDLENAGWTPIGDGSGEDDSQIKYAGTFDGDGHKITGLNSSGEFVGLFGFLGNGAMVKNMSVSGSVTIPATAYGKTGYAGGIAARNDGGSVYKVTADVTVSIQTTGYNGEAFVGGIIGENTDGLISDCSNACAIAVNDTGYGGNAYAGGIAGCNTGGTICDCSNTGAVTVNATAYEGNAMVGGIAGNNSDGNIRDCRNTGTIAARTEHYGACTYAGGIVGFSNNSGIIQNVFNTGSASAQGSMFGAHAHAGGIAGLTEGTVRYAFSIGDNSATATGSHADAHSGGIAGYNKGTVQNVFSTGTVSVTATGMSGSAHSGGIVGSSEGAVQNCYYDQSVCGNIGAVNGADDTENNVIGLTTDRMTGTSAAYNMRGLFNSDGSSDNWYVTDSYPRLIYKIEDYSQLKAFAGSVNNGDTSLHAKLMKDIDASSSASANDWTPIGYYKSDTDNNPFIGSFDGDGHVITGLTTPFDYDGYTGLFGYVGSDGTVMNVGLEGGRITGKKYVGGVVGINMGTVSSCYNKSAVTATKSSPYICAGGVTGYNYDGTVTNCYNTGTVTVTETATFTYVGGVTGANENSSITNCYNTENVDVTGDGRDLYFGGVVGYKSGGSVTNCYYDSSVSNDISAIGYGDTGEDVTGLTTAQMTGADALSNMTGFSDTVWLTKADDAEEGGVYYWFYPHLKGFNLKENGTPETDPGKIPASDWPAKAEVTVTLSEYSFGYDGTPHMPSVISVINGGKTLAPNTDYTVSYYKKVDSSWSTETVDPVDAGDYKAVVKFTADGHSDIEKEFSIDLKSVTVTAESASKVYDGSALTESGFTASALETGDSHTFTVEMTENSTIVNKGTAENVIATVDGVAVTPGSAVKVGNYLVTAVNGTLEITPADVTVAITGNSSVADYDGSEKSVNGYTATASNTLYDVENDIDFSGTALATLTEPGTVSMGLDAGQFSNNNTNFNVTFTVVQDGKLTVNPVVTFANEDGTPLQSDAVDLGSTPEYKGEKPVKADDEWYSYEFDKWTPDITQANDNATYTAAFTATPLEFTATFVDENGDTVDEIPYTVETASITEPAVPESEGRTGAWESYTLSSGGITVKPVYEANEYTATLIADGKEVKKIPFTYGQKSIDLPDVPEKTGYTGEWESYSLGASDITINAVYTPVKYTATFIADGKTVAEVPFTVETESITEPAVPEKEGYTGEWSEYTLAASDIEITAVYTEIPAEPATETEPENDNLCPLDGTDHGTTFMGKIIKFFHSILWSMFRIIGLDVHIRLSWAD